MNRIQYSPILVLIVVIFISFILLTGCSGPKKLAVKPNEHMEVGWTPRSVFQSASYAAWFDTTYAAYPVNEEITDPLYFFSRPADTASGFEYVDGRGEGGLDGVRMFVESDPATPVPEPSTLLLLGSGLAGLGGVAWRQHRHI